MLKYRFYNVINSKIETSAAMCVYICIYMCVSLSIYICLFKYNWFLMSSQLWKGIWKWSCLNTEFTLFIYIGIYRVHIQSSLVHINKIKSACKVLNNLLLKISWHQMLGQNHVWLLDAALKDLFFTKFILSKAV